MRHPLKRFGQSDCFLLLLCLGANLLVLLWCGFNPWLHFLGNEDAIWEHLPYYLYCYHGTLEEYWPSIMGGSVGQSIFGMPFLYFLYTGGLIEISSYFLVFHLTVMTSIAFYAVKIIELLTPPCPTLPHNKGRPERSVAYTCLLSIFFAAMPVMILRINAGHATHVLGFSFFFLGASLFFAALRGKLSVTLVLFSLVMLLQIFPYYDYQEIHHSIVYAWPLMIVLLGLYPRQLWQNLGEKVWRKVIYLNLPNLLLIIGAFGVCFYFFYGMFAAFTGDDIARNLSGKPVTFSYLISTWKDLWSSLFFSTKITTYPHGIFHLHESNHPLGPFFWIILLLFFIPACKLPTLFSPRLIASWLSGWFLFFILLSLQIEPWAEWFAQYVPYAGAFRIPERVFFLAIYIVQIVAIVVGQHLFSIPQVTNPSLRKTHPAISPSTKYLILVLLGLILSLDLINSAILEVIVYLLMIFLLVTYLHKTWPKLKFIRFPGKFGFYVLLVFNTALALQGYKERELMRPFTTWEYLVRLSMAGKDLHQKLPKMYGMERVVFDFNLQRFLNFNQLIMLPSLDGYTVAQRRFGELIYASHKAPFNPLQYAFKFYSNSSDFAFFKNLYAINYRITGFGGDEPFKIIALPHTPSVWFPEAKMQEVEDYTALIKTGMQHINDQTFFDQLLVLHNDRYLYQQAWQQAEDTKALRSPTKRELASQTVFQSQVPPEINNQTKPAPIVVAINYANILTAIGRYQNAAGKITSVILPTFAANGPLLGIMLPPQHKFDQVVVRAVHPWVAWGKYVILLGGLSIMLALCFYVRRFFRPTLGTDPNIA